MVNKLEFVPHWDTEDENGPHHYKRLFLLHSEIQHDC